MTDLIDIPDTRPNGVRRQPTAKALDLAEIINLALAGATFKQIARELNADHDAVRHLLNSPDGQRALRYAINDLQERTDRFLVSSHLQALRTLVKEMNEALKPGDRIRAAQAITGLATKRIEISGPGGGPIDVNAAVIDALDERIALMKERSRGIIEAQIVEPLVEIEPVVEIIEPIVVAEVPTVPVETLPQTAPLRRMPAPIIRPRR